MQGRTVLPGLRMPHLFHFETVETGWDGLCAEKWGVLKHSSPLRWDWFCSVSVMGGVEEPDSYRGGRFSFEAGVVVKYIVFTEMSFQREEQKVSQVEEAARILSVRRKK